MSKANTDSSPSPSHECRFALGRDGASCIDCGARASTMGPAELRAELVRHSRKGRAMRRAFKGIT